MQIAQQEGAALRAANWRAAAMIAAFLAARLVFAWALGFGIDEAYTLAISRDLSLSYFDHPPLHQWIAHFVALSLGEGVGARLPFILIFAATGWLLYRLTLGMFGPRAALIALFGLNVAPFFFASAGSWIVPDAPLLFGLALAALTLSRIFFEPDADEGRIWRLWLLVGLSFGLAGLSKYIAALAVLGLLAFLVISRKERAGFAIPLLTSRRAGGVDGRSRRGLEFATRLGVLRSSGGARRTSGGLKPVQVLQIALGQIAYLSPWLFVPLAAGLASALRDWRDERRLFLLCFSLPAIVLLRSPRYGARAASRTGPCPAGFSPFH